MSVETEGNNDFGLSCGEDQEKVDEVFDEIVSKTEEKSDGEGSGGSDSYVVVCEPVEENLVFEDKPRLELNEEKVVIVEEFDDACKPESDSCVKVDVTDDFVENLEVNVTVDDDEKVEEVDNQNSVQQNQDGDLNSREQDIVNLEVENGENLDLGCSSLGDDQNIRMGSVGEIVQSQESEDMILENIEVKQSEDDVFVVEEPSPSSPEEMKVLDRETYDCPQNTTSVEVAGTDRIHDSGDDNGTSVVTEGEAKEDGYNSYVFVDGVETGSDDSVEREAVDGDQSNLNAVTENEEEQVYSHDIIVGSVVCGTTQNSSPSAQSSPSVNNTKLEIGEGNSNYSSDNVLSDAINALTEPGSNETMECQFGTYCTLRNMETTPSSNVDKLGEKVDEIVEKTPIYRYLIRVPRYIDDGIGEQIELARLQLEEITRKRDAFRVEIQAKQATCDKYHDEFEAARLDQRAAYDALNVKRQEMASVQSTLNKLKNAISIDEMSDKILNMQHRMVHETISLKEEKQFMHEIKQLKLRRQQLISDREAETQPTLDQKESLEESLLLAKKDLDSARAAIQQAEGITNNSKKLYADETQKLRNLRLEYKSIDVSQQEAYARLQKLKKQQYDKNKHFRAYKDDSRKAQELGYRGDRAALHQLCLQQTENVMELWNNNGEFRNEYIRCNAWSTVKRLGSLDGRSLNPGEHPPIVRKPGDEKVVVKPTVSNSEQVKPKEELKLREKDQTIEPKKPTEILMEKTEEEIKKTQEEEELARKEEVLRKEAAEAKIREQLVLEEKAKAKEAEERKKRNAEKAKARAELKAKKEAELKEKERAKKEKKKARKNASKDGNETELLVQSLEDTVTKPSEEVETEEKPRKVETGEKQVKVVTKRPVAKQSKAKVVPLPAPLRNRSKKRMQAWMWVLLVVVVVAVVALLPNLWYLVLENVNVV